MYTVQPLQCIFNSPFHVCAAAVYKSDDRYSSTAIRTHRAHSIRQSEKWTMSHANNAVTWGRCQLHSLQLLRHHQSAPDLEQATPSCTSTGSLFAASWWCLGVGQEFSGQSGREGRWGLGQKLFTKQFRSIQYFYTGQPCRCVQAVHMPWK